MVSDDNTCLQNEFCSIGGTWLALACPWGAPNKKQSTQHESHTNAQNHTSASLKYSNHPVEALKVPQLPSSTAVLQLVAVPPTVVGSAAAVSQVVVA